MKIIHDSTTEHIIILLFLLMHLYFLLKNVIILHNISYSLWETLTSSPWWKTILITIILIVLFLLFAPWICNCVIGFVSSCMKAFKLQMVVQAPMSATASSNNYYLGPLDQRPSI